MKKLLLFDYGGVIQNSICSEYTWKDAVNEMIAVCNPENANILKLLREISKMCYYIFDFGYVLIC